MKISAHNQNSVRGRPAARRGESGSFVISLLVILAIMLIYVNANMRLLGSLQRELKLVEQAQIQRLEKTGAQPLPLSNSVTNAAFKAPAAPAGQ